MRPPSSPTRPPHVGFVAPETPSSPAPSAERVFHALDESDEPLPTTEIAQRTGLPERTVRYAVRWLEDRRIVERTVRLSDARRQVVRVRSRPSWGLSDREHAAWFRGH